MPLSDDFQESIAGVFATLLSLQQTEMGLLPDAMWIAEDLRCCACGEEWLVVRPDVPNERRCIACGSGEVGCLIE